MSHSCKPNPYSSARLHDCTCSLFFAILSSLSLSVFFTMAFVPESLIRLLIPVLITYIAVLGSKVEAQADDSTLGLITDALEWQLPMSAYGAFDVTEDGGNDVGEDGEDEFDRRSLFWKRMHYYISYGALSANRVPCPPRSGRSYYTHNCFRAHGIVHPYTRGCSKITRCRR